MPKEDELKKELSKALFSETKDLLGEIKQEDKEFLEDIMGMMAVQVANLAAAKTDTDRERAERNMRRLKGTIEGRILERRLDITKTAKATLVKAIKLGIEIAIAAYLK